MLNWVVSNIALCVKPTVPQRSLSGFFYKILFRLSPELICDVETFAHTKKKTQKDINNIISVGITNTFTSTYIVCIAPKPVIFFLVAKIRCCLEKISRFRNHRSNSERKAF